MAKLNAMLELDLAELGEKTKRIQTDSGREFATLKTMLFLVDTKMKEFEKILDKFDTVTDQLFSILIFYY